MGITGVEPAYHGLKAWCIAVLLHVHIKKSHLYSDSFYQISFMTLSFCGFEPLQQFSRPSFAIFVCCKGHLLFRTLYLVSMVMSHVQIKYSCKRPVLF